MRQPSAAVFSMQHLGLRVIESHHGVDIGVVGFCTSVRIDVSSQKGRSISFYLDRADVYLYLRGFRGVAQNLADLLQVGQLQLTLSIDNHLWSVGTCNSQCANIGILTVGEDRGRIG